MVAAKQNKKVAPKPAKFVIDCAEPAQHSIVDMASFEKFLHERIKIDGKVGALGDKVKITRDQEKLVVGTKNIQFSKRYLKYLTKKFLKSQQLRDYIRVVAKAKNSYHLKFFRNQKEEAEAEE